MDRDLDAFADHLKNRPPRRYVRRIDGVLGAKDRRRKAASAQARAVASNFAMSRAVRRSTGRQSITTAEPSLRWAKKSGACDTRLPRSTAQHSQNGWDAMPTTAALKSKDIT